jgi:hypothetical protein
VSSLPGHYLAEAVNKRPGLPPLTARRIKGLAGRSGVRRDGEHRSRRSDRPKAFFFQPLEPIPAGTSTYRAPGRRIIRWQISSRSVLALSTGRFRRPRNVRRISRRYRRLALRRLLSLDRSSPVDRKGISRVRKHLLAGPSPLQRRRHGRKHYLA